MEILNNDEWSTIEIIRRAMFEIAYSIAKVVPTVVSPKSPVESR
jgi:hypothetical protein